MWCGAPPRGTMAPDWGGITRGAVKLTLFCLINNYRSCQAAVNYVGSAKVSGVLLLDLRTLLSTLLHPPRGLVVQRRRDPCLERMN